MWKVFWLNVWDSFRCGVSSSGSIRPGTFFFKQLYVRYNSHTIQITHLKYSIQWLLVYLPNCAAITTITFRTCFSPQKEIPYSLPVTPHSLSPSALGNQKSTLYAAINLPILDISFKWNHTICGLLCLVCFT